MGPCYTPSLRTRAEVLHELKNCRTFAFDRVMERGAQELEKMQAEIDRLREEVASKSEQIGRLYRVCNERDVLRVAIKPFAEIGLLQDADHRPGLPDLIDAPDLSITPADVRRARDALSRPQRDEGKG